MSETSPPYGDPPAQATRVTESELLEIESDQWGAVGLLEREGFAEELVFVRKLGAEIRRYRALLIRLAGPPGSQPYCCACIFCNKSDGNKHYDGCPWPELEAEVLAIREELRP